ncbi:MAG: agmatinase family protein [Flavobacteriales bacterium]
MKNKQTKIDSFDPNAPGDENSNLFGLPFTEEESEIIILPVPWEVTTSYGGGTSDGPSHIMQASKQVDLYHPDFPNLWKKGIYMQTPNADLIELNNEAKDWAADIIAAWESGENVAGDDERALLEKVSGACATMNDWVCDSVVSLRKAGKWVGLLGGDHSTPLGYYQAYESEGIEFGILHIDAHMDLRDAYEGFKFSHASIMFNALKLTQLKKLVQVGIRDFCLSEQNVVDSEKGRVEVYRSEALHQVLYCGTSWDNLCKEIVGHLPPKVHISFDIDGLEAMYCPNTGTPVPGGLSYEQILHLLRVFKDSRKQLLGFDLVEVASGQDDWNGNVGARLLYRLCSLLGEVH